jgi:hypothetical protein
MITIYTHAQACHLAAVFIEHRLDDDRFNDMHEILTGVHAELKRYLEEQEIIPPGLTRLVWSGPELPQE